MELLLEMQIGFEAYGHMGRSGYGVSFQGGMLWAGYLNWEIVGLNRNAYL